MRAVILVILMMGCHMLAAQNFTGIWRGRRTQNVGGCFPEYSLELHLNFTDDNHINGNAYSYYDKQRYAEISFSGRYNPLNHRMVLIEQSVIRYNIPSYCTLCMKTYDLNWSSQDGEEVLQGEWWGYAQGTRQSCPPGKIYLTRTTDPAFPVEVFQDDTLKSIQQKLHWEARQKELVQTIRIDTPAVHIQLYDNGEIDGDTVTIFLNNTLLLYKKRLTDQPLNVDITAFPHTDYELVMYADNLGSIPPNTALLILTAGKKRYELYLSSSEQKSAVVRFRLE